MSTRIFLDGSNSWRRWSCSSQTWWFSLLIRRRSLGKSCLHQVPGQRRHRDTEDMGEMNRLEEGQMTPLCWWASLPGLNCLLLLDEGQMPLLCWWASLPGLNCPLPLACPSQQELLANNECLHFKPKQQSASCNRRVDRPLLVTIKGKTCNTTENSFFNSLLTNWFENTNIEGKLFWNIFCLQQNDFLLITATRHKRQKL